MTQQPQAHKLRSGRYSQSGLVYLLTTVTQGRQPVFGDFDGARALIGVLREQQALNHAQTLAFVVMPDHLHWLMQLGDRVDLSRCMRTVKSMSARRIGRPIWQRGFHDHALRSDDDIPAMARYIVRNPVRAGLVTRTGLYPHWDAIWV
jgi:putative transposase